MYSMKSFVKAFMPCSMRDLARALKLHQTKVHVSEIPDLSYIIEIYRFAGQHPDTREILNYYFNSTSQIHQDLLAHFVCENKYFVEFGACDGIESSNTLWLEKKQGWSGLLAEPGRSWYQKLTENRSAKIVNKAIAHSSNRFIEFAETENPVYSTFIKFVNNDSHSNLRQSHNRYLVDAISLHDFLKMEEAPETIGYLSIDTEGSEYEILCEFDFKKYSFELITVEHNFTQNQDLIDLLLVTNGYTRILSTISGGDAWYINNSLRTKFGIFSC